MRILGFDLTHALRRAGLKTIGQVAKDMEMSSEQAVLQIIVNGGSDVLVFDKNLDMDQVEEFLFHPLSIIASDGAGFGLDAGQSLVHPRCFGTAPKFLKLALDKKTNSLEQAIKKLTSYPAKKMGLKKRGAIAVNNFADLVIFNPAAVEDKATYQSPYQYSRGIDYVLVNGKTVVEKGMPTGTMPGRALRKVR